MDLSVLCDTYVELKLAPIDAIWQFSIFTDDLSAICVSQLPPTFYHIEVLVVLAMPVKSYLK